MSNLEYGAFSYHYANGDLSSVASAIARDGFQYVQLSELPVHPAELTSALCHRVRQTFLDHNIRISNFYVHGNLSHPDKYVRGDAIHRLRAMIRWVRLLGTDTISAMPGSLDPRNEWNPHPENASQAALEKLADVVRELAAYAADHGVSVCLEPYFFSVAHTAERMKHLIDYAGRNVGVMFDPAATIGPDRADDSTSALEHDLSILGDHLHVVHVEDLIFKGDSPSFVLPGEGIVDWSTCYQLLKEYGWNGPLHLEIPREYDAQRARIEELFG